MYKLTDTFVLIFLIFAVFFIYYTSNVTTPHSETGNYK